MLHLRCINPAIMLADDFQMDSKDYTNPLYLSLPKRLYYLAYVSLSIAMPPTGSTTVQEVHKTMDYVFEVQECS